MGQFLDPTSPQGAFDRESRHSGRRKRENDDVPRHVCREQATESKETYCVHQTRNDSHPKQCVGKNLLLCCWSAWHEWNVSPYSPAVVEPTLRFGSKGKWVRLPDHTSRRPRVGLHILNLYDIYRKKYPINFYNCKLQTLSDLLPSPTALFIEGTSGIDVCTKV